MSAMALPTVRTASAPAMCPCNSFKALRPSTSSTSMESELSDARACRYRDASWCSNPRRSERPVRSSVEASCRNRRASSASLVATSGTAAKIAIWRRSARSYPDAWKRTSPNGKLPLLPRRDRSTDPAETKSGEQQRDVVQMLDRCFACCAVEQEYECLCSGANDTRPAP